MKRFDGEVQININTAKHNKKVHKKDPELMVMEP